MIPSGDSFLLWRGHSARREMDERPSRRAPASCWSRVFCALVLIHLCPIAAAGREVVLLYTGATKSFLEAWSSEGSAPTGSGRVGGLARRATLVRDLRRGHPNALLVDAGGLFDGDSDLDRLRCSTHLRAVSAMGYDAVNVGADELRYGRAFLEAEWDSSGVAFTSANLVGVGDAKTLVPAYRVLETGGVRIGFIGVAGRETASAVTTTSGPTSACT